LASASLKKLPVHHQAKLHKPIGNHAKKNRIEENFKMGIEFIH